MKVLHVALQAFPQPGIIQQMQTEADAAHGLAIPWQTRLFLPRGQAPDHATVCEELPTEAYSSEDSQLLRARKWWALRWNFCRHLKKIAPNYDILLLRYSLADPLTACSAARLPCTIFNVHHTKEEDELTLHGGRWGTLRARLDRWCIKHLSQKATGLVGVTDEILEYESKRIGRAHTGFLYPNGIFLRDIEIESLPSASSAEPPEFIFMASYFAPWHGLDLILSSLSGSRAKFKLHLVGALSPEDDIKARQDARVVIHGCLGRDAYIGILKRCRLGLTSFALDRKGMREACTLKVREYLAAGLPVYSGHQDIFPGNFRFFTNGPADISAILKFADEMKSACRKDVARAALPHISKVELLKRLYKQLSNLVQESDEMREGELV